MAVLGAVVVALAACGDAADECTAGNPEEFRTRPPIGAIVGRVYTYAPKAVFREFEAPVYYELVEGPPGARLGLDMLEWTPSAAGSWTFAVRATVDGFTPLGEYRRSVVQRWCVTASSSATVSDDEILLRISPVTVRVGEPVTVTAMFADGTAKLMPWQLVVKSGVPVQVTPAAGRTDVVLEVIRADGHIVLLPSFVFAQ